jgi:hypothetical protein
MRAVTCLASAASPAAMVRLDDYATSVCAVAATPIFDGTEPMPPSFTAGLTPGGASLVAAPTIIAPDGSFTAQKLVEDGTNGRHGFQPSAAVNSLTATTTMYAKAAERTFLQITIYTLSAGRVYAFFDLINGRITAQGIWVGTQPFIPFTATMQPALNGWWKCTVSANNTAAGVNLTSLFSAISDRAAMTGVLVDTNPSYQGNGSWGIYVWQRRDYNTVFAPVGPQFSIDGSFDDPNSLDFPVPAASMFWWTASQANGAQAQISFIIAAAPLWARTRLTNGVGQVRATFLQVGDHSHSNITAGKFSPFLMVDDIIPGDNFLKNGGS